jgi:UDP-3-O-[3-hydroxymyristoyl] glucosamine N-acyltransferase
MKFTARQIAELIGGRIEGNPEVSVDRLSKIEEGEPGSLSFLANPRYNQYIYNTEASIIIINEDFIPEREVKPTLIRVEDAYSAFARLLDYYDKVKKDKKGISSMAFISDSATLGDDLYIAEFVYVGSNVKIGNNVKLYPHVYLGDNVVIGDNTVIYSGVKIYSDTVVGKNCTFHSAAVIGSDGFGFAPQENSHYKKVAQIGNVIIEDDVEIGAGTTIDRATLGSTVLRKGVKLDNLIQVAHNVDIGENTVIAAQTGISGSTKIGKNCMIAGQVGITGHLNIPDNVKIGAQSGIAQNLKEGAIVVGSPAFEVKKYWRSYAYFKNITDLVERLVDLEKKVKDLTGKSKQ